jgi:hypothetical protein
MGGAGQDRSQFTQEEREGPVSVADEGGHDVSAGAHESGIDLGIELDEEWVQEAHAARAQGIGESGSL